MAGADTITGSTEVVALLQHFIDEAHAGRLPYVVVAAAPAADRAGGGVAGNRMYEPVALQALKHFADELDQSIKNRTLPPRNPALGADHVCYPVPLAPLGFDFITWLVAREMDRVREGAPAPLKVAFWFGNDGNTELDPHRQMMLDNVVRPALRLIGAVEDDAAMLGRVVERYMAGDVVAGAMAGEPVPVLKAPTQVEFGVENPVTITLRESDRWPERNSNLIAWTKFAHRLERRGEQVIFVRDTAKADEPLSGFKTCPLASRNLIVRMALYEQAKANLFVSNGPASLAQFSARPWLMFLDVKEGSTFAAETPDIYRQGTLLDLGQQYPWSRPDQRIVWKRDSYDNIAAAWHDLERCVVSRTAAE